MPKLRDVTVVLTPEHYQRATEWLANTALKERTADNVNRHCLAATALEDAGIKDPYVDITYAVIGGKKYPLPGAVQQAIMGWAWGFGNPQTITFMLKDVPEEYLVRK